MATTATEAVNLSEIQKKKFRTRNGHLSSAQMIDELRRAFDARVSKQFCILPEEASQLLQHYSIENILQAFTDVHRFLKHLAKNKSAGAPPMEEETMVLIEHALSIRSAGNSRKEIDWELNKQWKEMNFATRKI